MIVCELMRGWGLRAHRAILYTHSSDGRSRMYGATVRRVHVSIQLVCHAGVPPSVRTVTEWGRERERERRVFGYTITNRDSGVCVGSSVPGERASSSTALVSAVARDAFNTTSCLQWTRRTRTELRPVTRGPEWLVHVGPGS